MAEHFLCRHPHLFFMCSGALFLNPAKEVSIRKLFRRSLPRVLLAMLFWAAVYKLYGLISTGTLLFSAKAGALDTRFPEGMTVGPALAAAGAFGLCSRIKSCGAFATRLSKASFCIYLVHVLILYLLRELGVSLSLLPCLVSIPLLAALALAISFGIYLVLSKIPFANKWLI